MPEEEKNEQPIENSNEEELEMDKSEEIPQQKDTSKEIDDKPIVHVEKEPLLDYAIDILEHTRGEVGDVIDKLQEKAYQEEQLVTSSQHTKERYYELHARIRQLADISSQLERDIKQLRRPRDS